MASEPGSYRRARLEESEESEESEEVERHSEHALMNARPTDASFERSRMSNKRLFIGDSRSSSPPPPVNYIPQQRQGYTMSARLNSHKLLEAFEHASMVSGEQLMAHTYVPERADGNAEAMVTGLLGRYTTLFDA